MANVVKQTRTLLLHCVLALNKWNPSLWPSSSASRLQVDSRSSFRSPGGRGGRSGSGPKPHQQPTTAADAGASGRGEEELCVFVCLNTLVSSDSPAAFCGLDCTVFTELLSSSSSLPTMSVPLKLREQFYPENKLTGSINDILTLLPKKKKAVMKCRKEKRNSKSKLDIKMTNK